MLGKPVKKILVIDYAGNGFNVLWTLDGKTWICATRRSPLNEHGVNIRLERMQRDYPNAEIRWVIDAAARIPEDWRVEGTRVI